MTTTPLATIADALIEFILSLLRDPAAAAEFSADPEGSLAKAGLSDVCGSDVRAVAPVIVEHPQVLERPVPVEPTVIHVPHGHRDPEVVKQITNLANNYHIDNRSTIVDQSVNQSIWAEGDVMQIFDQEAVLATGDDSIAAGDDVFQDNSETDVTTGDIAVGNTTTDVDIDGSFNDESSSEDTTLNVAASESFNDSSTDTDVDVEVEDSFNEETDVEVENDVDIDVTAGDDVEMEVAAPAAVEVSEDPVADTFVDDEVEEEPLPDPDFEES